MEEGVAARRLNALGQDDIAEYGVPPGYATHGSFIAAVARGEEAALRELYLQYAPLLREQARAVGVPAADRDELALTVLETFALYLIEVKRPPRDVARYLVAALRNRARNLYRDRKRRRSRYESAYGHWTDTDERVVAECHSEYGLRAARDPAGEPVPPARHAITQPAMRSAQALSDEDRQLMVGIAHRVPLRDLAAQLGINYGTARVRVHRLRERFRKLAAQQVAQLAPAERREAEAFFRRAGVHLEIPIPGRGRHEAP